MHFNPSAKKGSLSKLHQQFFLQKCIVSVHITDTDFEVEMFSVFS